MSKLKDELEDFYKTKDPWQYQRTLDDTYRKQRIVDTVKALGKFDSILDVGAGEGWITTDLPAKEIYGYELSDTAAARFPDNVVRVFDPTDKVDVVVATGVLYSWFDYKSMTDIINRCATKYVVTSSMPQGEYKPAIEAIQGKEMFNVEFPYRTDGQILRVFRVKGVG